MGKQLRFYERILLIMSATPKKSWRSGEMARLIDAHPREVRSYFMKSAKVERVGEGLYRLARNADGAQADI